MSAVILSPEDQATAGRWQRLAFVAGLIGVGACLVGALVPDLRPYFFRAWLVAFCFYVGIALGSLVVIQLQYLVGGDWGLILRRPMEAAIGTLPLLAVLFVPLAFGLGDLYEWAVPAKVAEDKMLLHKAPYLNPTFFLIRALGYFVLWSGVAWLFRFWSRRQDAAGGPQQAITSRCETLSAPGMILYVVTITFASIDWVMSLEAHWYSTIYGAMFGMGQVLSGFAFAVAVVAVLVARKPLSDEIVAHKLRDLGSLMLAFVMVWAYLSLMQFLLIWSGNLPEEVTWYVVRTESAWGYVALALILLHFAFPFMILLSSNSRARRTALLRVSALILIMRVADLLWLIVPAFDNQHAGGEHVESALAVISPVLYLAALVGMGGLWFGYFLRLLASMPLLPVGVVLAREEAHHG